MVPLSPRGSCALPCPQAWAEVSREGSRGPKQESLGVRWRLLWVWEGTLLLQWDNVRGQVSL